MGVFGFPPFPLYDGMNELEALDNGTKGHIGQSTLIQMK